MSTHPLPDTNPTLHVDEKGVAWITFDDPERKVNVLTEQILTRLDEQLGELRNLALHSRVHVVVLLSGKSGFFAGADLAVIEALEDPAEGAEGSRFGQRIFRSLREVGVPTVPQARRSQPECSPSRWRLCPRWCGAPPSVVKTSVASGFICSPCSAAWARG